MFSLTITGHAARPGRRAAGLLFSLQHHPNSFAAMCLSDGRSRTCSVSDIETAAAAAATQSDESEREGEPTERAREGRQSGLRQIKRSGEREGKKRWRRFPRDPLLYLCGTISRRSLLSSSLLPPRPSRQFYDDRTLSAKAIMVGFLALASLCLRPSSSSFHLPWESGSRESSACNADEFPSLSVITVSAASSDQ